MDPYLKIKLHNWRCFQNTCFRIPQKDLFLIDENGSGKTSVLSALYSLITKESWGDSKMIQNIAFEKNYFGISTDFAYLYLTGEIGATGRIRLKQELPEERQWQKVFGIKSRPQIFSYSPIDNYWLGLSNAGKLKIIDKTLSQIYQKAYQKPLKDLQKAILEKNKILKTYHETQKLDKVLLTLINQKIITDSKVLWFYRKEFFEYLQSRLQSLPNYLNTSAKKLDISWKKNKFDDIKYFQNLEDENIHIPENLEHIRSKELIVGRNLWGAGRDEFLIKFHEQDITEIFSQGEMRMLILYFKQIIIEFSKQKESKPIWIFLDDVLSELDEFRQEILFTKVYKDSDWILGTGISAKKNFELKTYSLDQLKI